MFTFGKSKFAENAPSKFWIKKDEVVTNLSVVVVSFNEIAVKITVNQRCKLSLVEMNTLQLSQRG